MPIQNVSDTALWVAYYRAVESDRPDALFEDPLARRLAGSEGEKIARELGGSVGMATGMAVRTRIIDELILEAIRTRGVVRVLCLACGLDARPYRLKLPESFEWIEADLPALVAFKESRLNGASAVCKLERHAVDLADGAARRGFLREKLGEGGKTLVLTEGLLCYLTIEQVRELAEDLKLEKAAHYWVTDLFSERFIRMVQKTWGRRLAKGNAPIHFGAQASLFGPWGWKAIESRSILEEARKLKRDFAASRFWRPIFKLLPERVRSRFRESYSIVLLEASET